jgi:hypothetical protein
MIEYPKLSVCHREKSWQGRMGQLETIGWQIPMTCGCEKEFAKQTARTEQETKVRQQMYVTNTR